MAINFSQQVLEPSYKVFARPVAFTPTKSQPGRSVFSGRGIYGTQAIDVLAEDSSIFSDARTVLDVMEEDFTAVPIQGDSIYIPAHIGMPEVGSFEVIETNSNGGGETTLVLRRLMPTVP